MQDLGHKYSTHLAVLHGKDLIATIKTPVLKKMAI